MKAVLFDLDDTLYPETEFVESGFRAVARYLSSRHQFHEDTLVKQMLDILQKEGRGKIFDSLLRNLGLYSEDRVRLLVYLYRSHRPTIHLYADVLPTLECLRSYGLFLGIVTDGMASVQRNKTAVLGLDSLLDVIICTDELGKEFGKPSVVPFKVALELLRISPAQAVYVGDDAYKDFVGPNSLGMLAIQVKRQGLKSIQPSTLPVTSKSTLVVEELQEILPIVGAKSNVA